MDVRFLGPETVMPRADRLAYLIEQFRFRRHRYRLNARCDVQSAVNHRERRFACLRTSTFITITALLVSPHAYRSAAV